MHTLGRFAGAGRDLEGNLTLTFAVDEGEAANIEKLKDCDLVIDIKKFYEKRSLNANRYFWKLCDLIAEKLGSDKDTIYLMQIRRDGVWQDFEARRETLPLLKQMFREVEILKDGIILYDQETGETEDRFEARCYLGSSHYDKKQMARLIDGTVQAAKELGIETWTQEEIDRLINTWEANK